MQVLKLLSVIIAIYTSVIIVNYIVMENSGAGNIRFTCGNVSYGHLGERWLAVGRVFVVDWTTTLT